MIVSDAIFSKDKVYRYVLTREWDEKKSSVMFIGLNPSTADETRDDPTIRRFIGFAKSWGFGKMYVLNAFAFRATYPKDLFSAEDLVCPENDSWIKKISEDVDEIILAYGNLVKKSGRHDEILKVVDNPYCIKVSKIGLPMHPLYLKYTSEPLKFKV